MTDVVTLGDRTEQDVLGIAARLEKLSEHPLAKAIVKKAEEDGLVVKPADEFSAITGKGAFGRVDEQTYYIGNPRLFAELHG